MTGRDLMLLLRRKKYAECLDNDVLIQDARDGNDYDLSGMCVIDPGTKPTIRLLLGGTAERSRNPKTKGL